MGILIGGKAVAPPSRQPELETVLTWAAQAAMTRLEASERVPVLERILDGHEDEHNWAHYYVELRISRKEITECDQRLSALAETAVKIMEGMSQSQREAALSSMHPASVRLLNSSPFASVLSMLSPSNSTSSGTSGSDGWIDTPATSRPDETR